MFTYKKFEKWADGAQKLILDAHFQMGYIDRLKSHKYPNEKEAKRSYSTFFNNYYREKVILLVLQLSKLFSNSRNQHYRFAQLLNSLTTQYFDETLKEKISNEKYQEQVLHFINTLSENDELISRITKYRNEWVSHLDFNRGEIKLSQIELKLLVTLSHNIYNTLWHKPMLGSTFEFSYHFQWEIDPILKSIASAYSKLQSD